jgi:hypothetical protein
MIMDYRDIFPNFYAVPTPWLDRHYLKGVREFLLHGMTKHRLLMLALYQDSTDLLCVFEEWRRWSTEMRGLIGADGRARKYYASSEFSDDILSFASEHYAVALARFPHLVRTMAAVEKGLVSLRANQTFAADAPARKPARNIALLGADAVPVIRDNIRVIKIEADYKKLVRCLRRKGRLERIAQEEMVLVLLKVGEQIKILQLNRITYRLLYLCDGSRSVREVADNLLPSEQIDGVSMSKAGLYGLTLLTQQGLIDIKSTSLNAS